jgi:hypothetical protein
MRWAEIESEQPRLAAVGRKMLGGPGVVLVATIRRDGTARVSPVEPMFWDGDLCLSMGWGSRKAADLQRDPRILVHSIVTKRDGSDGEFKVRGRAISISDPDEQLSFAEGILEALGWQPEPGKSHPFRIDIDEVTVVRWNDASNDQFISRWPAMIEEVRRGTSAQSHAPPEPISDLLV